MGVDAVSTPALSRRSIVPWVYQFDILHDLCDFGREVLDELSLRVYILNAPWLLQKLCLRTENNRQTLPLCASKQRNFSDEWIIVSKTVHTTDWLRELSFQVATTYVPANICLKVERWWNARKHSMNLGFRIPVVLCSACLLLPLHPSALSEATSVVLRQDPSVSPTVCL